MTDGTNNHTKPARVVKVTEAGVINVLGPTLVAPGDFLLTYDYNQNLYSYLAGSESGYTGYLCDNQGNILSNSSHIPGCPNIPLLGFETTDTA